MKVFCRFVCIVLIVELVPLLGYSKDRQKHQIISKYFYSLPEQAGSEWGYLVPDCAPLKKKQLDKVVKCERISTHELCHTKDKVNLTNVINNEKRDFNLLIHVFKTKTACVNDRESALAGEE